MLNHQSHTFEALETLLEKADLQGYLTSGDIMDVFPWDGEDDERLMELFRSLHRQGVEIVIEVDAEPEPDLTKLESASLDFNASPLDSALLPNLENISADDSVGLYLKEMSRVPLLTLEEEVNLAQRIELATISKARLSKMNGKGSLKCRRELENNVQDGILAREHLIKANTRLVVSVAKKYIGRGVAFLDLIQEGNLGLMKAVSKFEYQRGFRFSTYATWWIWQAITLGSSSGDFSWEGAGESWQSHRFRRRYKPGPSIDELSEEIARLKRQLAMPETQGVARHKYAPRSRMSRPRIRR